jgi:hypothetical protein
MRQQAEQCEQHHHAAKHQSPWDEHHQCDDQPGPARYQVFRSL